MGARLRILFGLLLCFLGIVPFARASTFSGTNEPGAATNFAFKIGTTVTNWTLALPGSADAYSFLYVVKSGIASPTNYAYSATLSGTNNTIALEKPEGAAGNWNACVVTPPGSGSHAFTVTMRSNDAKLRSTVPVSKPLAFSTTGMIAASSWHYYRVEMPDQPVRWTVNLNSVTNTPDLYIQKDVLPSTNNFLKKSTGVRKDTLAFTDTELSAGVYYIGVHSPRGKVTYGLKADVLKMLQLGFDPGETQDGTVGYTHSLTNGGLFYFRIRTELPDVRAWRTALKVVSGEADIYMSRGTLPRTNSATYKSARVGSDGFVLAESQFAAGQDWYILVHAKPKSRWSLVSGAPFVTDLGPLAAEPTEQATHVIPPEGWLFYKTAIADNALAWRVWLNGATNNIYIRKTGVPLAVTGAFEVTAPQQMLLVPPYLITGDQYFVGVPGKPGKQIKLDSRVQGITDIGFESSTPVNVSGYGYSTYRVEVPPNMVAWQLDLFSSTATTKFYVRRSLVPNETHNEVLSELVFTNKSVCVVPPALVDGTFYITVVGTGPHKFTMKSGAAQVTDIEFVSQIKNQDTTRDGWRYFRIANIESQLGALGWELLLTNAPSGARIAVRRNQAPSIWEFRTGTRVESVGHYDYISQGTGLRRPNHQADIWYVGIYSPGKLFTKFQLTSRDMGATILSGDGGSVSESLPKNEWAYYRVDIPSDVLGWDLRLSNVKGAPSMVICRQALPATDINNRVVLTNVSTTLPSPTSVTNWPIAKQWLIKLDWTKRPNNALGSNEVGRVFAAGLGRPLEAGTYYIGIFNGKQSSSYTLRSRFIGPDRSISVQNIPFQGGIAANQSVAPREAAYYHVHIPPETRSWKLKLTVHSGEAMMVVSTNRVPNIESEKRVQKLDREHFVLLPDEHRDYIKPGDHYIAVIGEGVAPKNDRVGLGTCKFTLQSLGEMPEPNLGSVSSPIVRNDTLEGGEVKAYHFTIPKGMAGIEVFIKNKVGNPVGVFGYGTQFPDPGLGDGYPTETYGHEGGNDDTESHQTFNHHLYAAGDPDDGTSATVMMMARSVGGKFPNASYTLEVRPLIPPLISFDNGKANVTGHAAGTWKFFRVVVPPNALGWDLRLTNVTSGGPKLIVARTMLPIPMKNDGFNPQGPSVWPLGWRWPAAGDWTKRSASPIGVSEDGRILAMGMDKPLVPDTYYIGVYADRSAAYTLWSRGIGEGFTIPVRNLPFAGGTFTTASASALSAREAAYFRVAAPPGARSLQVSLQPTGKGEGNLLVLKDGLPSVLASPTVDVIKTGSAGRQMKKPGKEHFLMLPLKDNENIQGGNYYFAVISEGLNPTNISRVGASKLSFTVTSHGELPLKNLGTINSNAADEGVIEAGAVVGYQFEIPPGTVSLEAKLENRVGNPVMVLRKGPLLPDPALNISGTPSDTYGVNGGQVTDTRGHTNVITYANPTNGVYYLLVKARPVNTVYTNASFTLKLSVVSSVPLDFDGGQITISNQLANSWRYFRVDVPTNALGWDVRLTNVLSGMPKIVVSKDALPSSLQTRPWSSPGNQTNWPTTNQWTAVGDWTRRQFSAEGIDENGRILAMGMNRPLVPGSYYVGVSGTGTMSYTISSRGIGDGFTIPVTPLPFEGGSYTNTGLAARDAAYFRVDLPANAPSFKMKLTGLFGEAMMVGLRDAVPNVDYIDPNRSIQMGKTIQKAGNEQFLLLPPNGTNVITAGSVYFAVASEGALTNNSRIGRGSSGFILRTLGSLALTNMGVLSGTNEVSLADSSESGETKGYEFQLAPEVSAVEVKLENRVGNPVLVWRDGELLPNPGGSFSGTSEEGYGNEGGSQVAVGSQTLLTLTRATVEGQTEIPTRVLVKARATSGVFSDASYTVKLRPIIVPELSFSPAQNREGVSNSVTTTLENGHRAYYKVVVPEGQLGWKLEIFHTSGTASVRARKDQFPSDSPLLGTPFATPAAYIVPPVLTPGTWYVEVKAQSLTTFTLTSSALEMRRPAWVMPEIGNTNTAPGLEFPTFGDTAVETNGLPTASQSVFLESGYQHYYAFSVPSNNLGLVRLQLEAVSGNPNLYLRYGNAPTVTHSSAGTSGTLYERTVAGSVGTEYANFVPIDGKLESELKPGLWYVAVRAVGANSRYRIRFSTGNVQDIPVSGTLLTGQVVAGGDWRYYRFRMPNVVPTKWQLTFSKQLGDMAISIRDTVPPGAGASPTDRRHWLNDAKNHGPYPEFSAAGTYTFNTPPSRPGEFYYVGVRGINDATFSLSVATLEDGAVELPTIAFYAESRQFEIPAESQRIFRIDVPAEATRMKISNSHPTSIRMYMEQGTLPLKTSSDDWRNSSGTTSGMNQYLGAWPWVPGKSYFLIVSNSAASPQAVFINTDGKNAQTDDEDKDGMLDAWERQYFGNTSPSAAGDNDGDGVSNYNEFVEGTNPADKTSFNPRLLITTKDGSVQRSPDLAYYSKGSTVELSAVPALTNYAFVGWSGSYLGTNNPLILLMDTHKNLTATFKLIGDDFSIRVPLTGSSVMTNASNLEATKEPFEVDHGGNPGGRSLWWSWTASTSGIASISTEGSSFPTLLGVYIGDSITNLVFGTNDTVLSGGSYRAKVTMPVEAGVAYNIAVDGWNDASGTVQLAINLVPSGIRDGTRSFDPALVEVPVSLQISPERDKAALRFQVPAGTGPEYLIEASTDLINWRVIGSATDGIPEPVADDNAVFYRLRTP